MQDSQIHKFALLAWGNVTFRIAHSSQGKKAPDIPAQTLLFQKRGRCLRQSLHGVGSVDKPVAQTSAARSPPAIKFDDDLGPFCKKVPPRTQF